MKKLVSIAFLFGVITSSFSQQTTGLFQNDAEADEGFILWGPIFSHNQYLMNRCGEMVHTWQGDGVTLGNSVYLMDDGTLIRCAKADTAQNSTITAGGGGERIQMVDWDGAVNWDYIYYDEEKRLHHDIEILPNGNILAIAWVVKNQNACLQAGRDPSKLAYNRLLNERLIEIEPTGPTTGNIVWQWDLWDHLIQDFDATKDNFGVVADHPELLDINWLNQNEAVPDQDDFIHLNSVDYNAELDQILLSSQILSEIWIIDHSTTTSEAASHQGGTYGKGGDFLYRYGNPQVYQRGAIEDQRLWRQHDAHWIPNGYPDAGSIMIFNNGLDRPVSFSEIDVISVPQTNPGVYEALAAGQAYGPTVKTWNYHAPDSVSFYSYFISGAKRTPNGNTVICEGEKGRIFEVTYSGEKVWEYVNPVTFMGTLSSTDPIPMIPGGAFQGNLVFRAEKYPADYPAFLGRDLNSGVQLETNPFITCIVGVEDEITQDEFSIYPNPTASIVNIEDLNGATMTVFDHAGRIILTKNINSDRFQFDLSGNTAGIYALRFELKDKQFVRKLMVH